MMTSGLLRFAPAGGLDSQSVIPGTGFYEGNYTKPLLFLADGGYLDDLAGAILVPFIPGVRSIPRLIPIYRLIWRDYYREHRPPSRHTIAPGRDPPSTAT